MTEGKKEGFYSIKKQGEVITAEVPGIMGPFIVGMPEDIVIYPVGTPHYVASPESFVEYCLNNSYRKDLQEFINTNTRVLQKQNPELLKRAEEYLEK